MTCYRPEAPQWARVSWPPALCFLNSRMGSIMTNIAREHIIPPSLHHHLSTCPSLQSFTSCDVADDTSCCEQYRVPWQLQCPARQAVGVDTVRPVIRCSLLTIKVWSVCGWYQAAANISTLRCYLQSNCPLTSTHISGHDKVPRQDILHGVCHIFCFPNEAFRNRVSK